MIQISFKKVIKWVMITFSVLVIMFAILVSIGRLLTPTFNRHLPDFETWATTFIQSPITIGHVELSWQGIEPELTFNQVEVLDQTTHQPTIDIRRLVINFSMFRSLFSWKPILETLKIQGVTFTMHEKTAGKFDVAGMYNLSISGSATGNVFKSNQVLDWVFAQSKLSLREIEIQFISAKGAEKIILLDKLTLTNSGNAHSLSGKVTLQQDAPTDMELMIHWRGRVDDLSHATASIYCYLEGVSLTQWFKQYAWHGWRIQEGIGSAKIWADWKDNDWQNIRSQFQLYNLTLASLLARQTQSIPRLSGEVNWKREGLAQEITGQDILIDLPKHLWPTLDFSATLMPKSDHSLTLKTLNVSYLDMTDTLEWLQALKGLPADSMVFKLKPRGEIRQLKLTLPLEEEANYKSVSLESELSNIAVNEMHPYPGIEHLTGQFHWDGKEGHLMLDSHNLLLNYAGLFDSGLLFKQVSGKLALNQASSQSFRINAKNVMFSNNDLNLNTDFDLEVPEKEPTHLNFNAHFNVLNLHHLIQYLPTKVLNADLNSWLKQAFISGQLTSGEVSIKGNINDIPFPKQNGTILVAARAKDVSFKYSPDWPLIQHLNGRVAYQDRGIVIQADDGIMRAIPLQNIHAIVTHVGVPDPTFVNVEGTIRTNLTNGLEYIRQSPLNQTIGSYLSGADLSGQMEVVLGLNVPLAHLDQTTVKGKATLTNTTLSLTERHLVLEKVNGQFQFTDQHIEAKNFQGYLLGEKALFGFRTETPLHAPKFVQAKLTSQLKISALESWLRLPLAKFIQGETAYQAELNFPPQGTLEPLEMKLNSNLKGISVDAPSPYGKKAEEIKPFKLAIAVKSGEPLKSKIVYGNLRVDVANTSQGWQLGLTNPDMQGTLLIPESRPHSVIEAHFQRLNIPTHLTDSGNTLDPRTFPALSFVGDDVRFGDKRLNNVLLNIKPTLSGIAITNLRLNSPLVQVDAKGSWQRVNKMDETYLTGNMQTDDLTGLLNMWGNGESSLVAKKAEAQFDLSWKDAPYHPDFSKLSGTASMKVGEGRIINLSPASSAKLGVGRMLNILNLDTIPRRLSLDFSDLVQKGYSFDTIQGHFNFSKGSVYTQDTKINGPIAGIGISGRVGLSARDYDLMMVITPYVTSSIPVVAAIAVNPIAGIAAWIVDKAVSKEVSKVTSYYYKVTGSWDNPVWVKK